MLVFFFNLPFTFGHAYANLLLSLPPFLFLPRHRAVNLFLQGYNKSWISAEDHNFEEKLVEDLAVSRRESHVTFES